VKERVGHSVVWMYILLRTRIFAESFSFVTSSLSPQYLHASAPPKHSRPSTFIHDPILSSTGMMAAATATHSHDGHAPHSHSHELNAAEHGHSHEILDGPGSYTSREMPIIAGRDWNERAFTVGIGGYAPTPPYRSKIQPFQTRPATLSPQSNESEDKTHLY